MKIPKFRMNDWMKETGDIDLSVINLEGCSVVVRNSQMKTYLDFLARHGIYLHFDGSSKEKAN